MFSDGSLKGLPVLAALERAAQLRDVVYSAVVVFVPKPPSSLKTRMACGGQYSRVPLPSLWGRTDNPIS